MMPSCAYKIVKTICRIQKTKKLIFLYFQRKKKQKWSKGGNLCAKKMLTLKPVCIFIGMIVINDIVINKI